LRIHIPHHGRFEIKEAISSQYKFWTMSLPSHFRLQKKEWRGKWSNMKEALLGAAAQVCVKTKEE